MLRAHRSGMHACRHTNLIGMPVCTLLALDGLVAHPAGMHAPVSCIPRARGSQMGPHSCMHVCTPSAKEWLVSRAPALRAHRSGRHVCTQGFSSANPLRPACMHIRPMQAASPTMSGGAQHTGHQSGMHKQWWLHEDAGTRAVLLRNYACLPSGAMLQVQRDSVSPHAGRSSPFKHACMCAPLGRRHARGRCKFCIQIVRFPCGMPRLGPFQGLPGRKVLHPNCPFPLRRA